MVQPTNNQIFRERKTDLASLITVEDNVTLNGASLDGVADRLPLQMPRYRHLELLQRTPTNVIPSSDTAGIVRALLYALQELTVFVGKKKFIKNVVLVTNSRTVPELDEAFAQGIRQVVTDQQIRVKLLGVDFDEQNQEHLSNIASWYSLFSGLPGCSVWTGEDIKRHLEAPLPKLVRPVKVFNGDLRIGADLLDPEFEATNDLSCLCYSVEGYPGVKLARPPTKKTFGNGRIVSHVTEYQIRNYAKTEHNENELENNDDNELGQSEFDAELVDKSKLIKAYKYGSSTVVLPEELERQRVYPTQPGIDIVKIIPEGHFPRWYLGSETVLIMGQSKSVADIKAMAAVVDSLAELRAIGIARYVQKQNSEVQMCALYPVYVKRNELKRTLDGELSNLRALALSRIPFMEDEKMAAFPDLTNLTTTSGRVITGDHKLLPNEKTQILMDSLVAQMDLDGDELDFDGAKRVFNPITADFSLTRHDSLVKRSVGIRRIDMMMKTMAINGVGGVQKYASENEIPPVPASIMKDTQPDPKFDAYEPVLKQLKGLLAVAKVDKTKFKRGKPLEEVLLEEEDDISLEELLNRGAR